MKKFIDTWGVYIVIFLLLLIAFFVILTFRKTSGQKSEGDYTEKVELLERERQAIIKERDALQQVLNQRDSTIKVLNRVDSMLDKTISSNNKTIYEITKQREALNRFQHLTSDELKKFFTDLR